jgi:hypothetical protein
VEQPNQPTDFKPSDVELSNELFGSAASLRCTSVLVVELHLDPVLVLLLGRSLTCAQAVCDDKKKLRQLSI